MQAHRERMQARPFQIVQSIGERKTTGIGRNANISQRHL